MNETFRPRSNLVWAGISIFLIFLFAVNSFVVHTSLLQIAIEVTTCMLLTAVSYIIWIKPKLIFREDTMEIINPLRTELIPYRNVIELETKWALTITHTEGKTTVWVAPASGKRKWIAEQRFGMYGGNVPLSDSRQSNWGSMSGSVDSFSGQVAYMIRERIKRAH